MNPWGGTWNPDNAKRQARTMRGLIASNQSPDNALAIADRTLRARAAELAIADRRIAFPTLTELNADAAIEYQEQRIASHLAALAGGAK